MNNTEISKVISKMDKQLRSQQFHRAKELLLEGKPISLSIIQEHDDLVTLTDGLLTDRPDYYLNVYVHHSDLEELRARAEMMDL